MEEREGRERRGRDALALALGSRPLKSPRPVRARSWLELERTTLFLVVRGTLSAPVGHHRHSGRVWGFSLAVGEPGKTETVRNLIETAIPRYAYSRLVPRGVYASLELEIRRTSFIWRMTSGNSCLRRCTTPQKHERSELIGPTSETVYVPASNHRAGPALQTSLYICRRRAIARRIAFAVRKDSACSERQFCLACASGKCRSPNMQRCRSGSPPAASIGSEHGVAGCPRNSRFRQVVSGAGNVCLLMPCLLKALQ